MKSHAQSDDIKIAWTRDAQKQENNQWKCETGKAEYWVQGISPWYDKVLCKKKAGKLTVLAVFIQSLTKCRF